MRKKFNKKILVIGYGSVSQCTLPILLKEIDVDPNKITVIDFEDKSAQIKHLADKGIKYHRQKVTRENMSRLLSSHLESGGVLIDLAWNIGATDIIGWCHDHGVLYGEIFTKTPYEKSLYFRQMALREMCKGWSNAPTAVVDHGANPGLISHFTKQGLLDIAGAALEGKSYPAEVRERVRHCARKLDFAGLAMNLGVRVIHCSERDTQITNMPKQVDEFVGTWSIEGLREEGTAPAEMGWGTHEKELPPLAVVPQHGPKNQVFLAQMGMNTYVRSYVPGYDIVGMIIRHGEAFGISDRLTVRDDNGVPVYRPTVHYAYMPCDETIISLHELRARNYEIQPKLRIMNKEIIKGEDILGALIMGQRTKGPGGKTCNSWWTGSILDIHESRMLVPGQNATTIQVALGVVSAVAWMIENPRKGLCLPDDLPHDFVLGISKPYLGRFVSRAYDWTPLKNRHVYFKENAANLPDQGDPWQFRNFLLPR
jgi:homospermidine synthase